MSTESDRDHEEIKLSEADQKRISRFARLDMLEAQLVKVNARLEEFDRRLKVLEGWARRREPQLFLEAARPE